MVYKYGKLDRPDKKDSYGKVLVGIFNEPQ